MSTNILVVDDSVVERVLVEGLLSGKPGYRVRLANDGREALAAVAAEPPDLIVTDLVMPEMDGLELVHTMRRRHPEIPVILMTAHGDESTAVAALEAGAASYVPKAQRAERLLSAVERVMECAILSQSRQKMTRGMLEYHCRFALENDRCLIRALAAEMQQTMDALRFGDTVERIRVTEAFEEAMLNAMYHGNLEISKEELATVRAQLDDHLLDRLIAERCSQPHIAERRILVVAYLTEQEARFVIRDEGRGFNRVYVAGERKSDDPFATGQCRGMTLICSLMDEVKFNKAGNELVIRKCIS